MSPLLFMMLTGPIINHVKTSTDIIKKSKGKHHILAYMNDLKCHAPSRVAQKAISVAIREAASEGGLDLNEDKCDQYSVHIEPDESAFLLQVREGYKYLGFLQLDKDTEENFENTTNNIPKNLPLQLGNNSGGNVYHFKHLFRGQAKLNVETVQGPRHKTTQKSES